MKNVNKIIASLLAGSMVFSLAACGNPEGSGSNTGDTTGDTGAATAEPSTEATPAAEDGGAAAEVVKPETIKVMWDGTVFKEGENYAEAFYEALDAALGLHVEWVRPDHSGYGEQVGIAFNDMSTIADVVLLLSNLCVLSCSLPSTYLSSVFPSQTLAILQGHLTCTLFGELFF